LVGFLKNAVTTVKRILRKEPDAYLREVSGVIHVGAHVGQERILYARYNLDVVWIEPIPDIFVQLQNNLKDFPKQQAYQYLLTDQDNKEYLFHISNNNGASSSIFELDLHKEFWPEVFYRDSMTLMSTTLSSLVKREGLVVDKYDALVMDTQGSELLVLKGAVDLLSGFKYIKAEVPDFESYSGCCQVEELDHFLQQHGFQEYKRTEFASKEGVGSYYDIVYRKST
jgi:FkbM family methyltransferase